MKALVATINQILFVDLITQQTKIIEANRPDYYGISWWAHSNELVMSHSKIKTEENLVHFDQLTHSELGYLSFGEKISGPFLSNPHQILCAPNGWVVTTNTGRNCITLYDPANGFFKHIRVNNILWDREGEDNLCGEHFNSIFIKEDRLYVLAHAFYKNSYVLEYLYPECTLLNKYELPERSGLHNIWVDNHHNFISCHSASGELIEIKTNEIIWQGSAFHSRGLAATDDLIIVGDSEIAPRQDRSFSYCGLWMVDRKSLKTIDYIPLGPYGSLREVRLIDVPDEAHHGHVFKNRDHLENYNYLNDIKMTKLKMHHQISENSFVKGVNFIIGKIDVDSDDWLFPRDEYVHQSFLLAVSKVKPKENFTLSVDYDFVKNSPKEQHLSLIVGYQGSNDKNMLAIFLHFTSQKNCHLYLWKNTHGSWNKAEILIPEVEHFGTLKVKKFKNTLQIVCNNVSNLCKNISEAELAGNVGIRCQNARFRNFALV